MSNALLAVSIFDNVGRLQRGTHMPSSYAIGEHFETFIKSKVQEGRYASASEVVRDGLR